MTRVQQRCCTPAAPHELCACQRQDKHTPTTIHTHHPDKDSCSSRQTPSFFRLPMPAKIADREAFPRVWARPTRTHIIFRGVAECLMATGCVLLNACHAHSDTHKKGQLLWDTPAFSTRSPVKKTLSKHSKNMPATTTSSPLFSSRSIPLPSKKT